MEQNTGSVSFHEPQPVGLYLGGVLLVEKLPDAQVLRFKAANGDAVDITEDQFHDLLYKLACDAKAGGT